MTPAGAVAEFPIPTVQCGPYGITAGPDGNLWFAELAAGKIGRTTPAGAITEYPVPTSNSGPLNIAAGQGRTLWFTEFQGGKVGRITGI
jgi:virginiamycin B lyase